MGEIGEACEFSEIQSSQQGQSDKLIDGRRIDLGPKFTYIVPLSEEKAGSEKAGITNILLSNIAITTI